MLDTNDFLIPRAYTGELIVNDPPLFFWTAMGAAKLMGKVDGWSLRMPSVLAASLAAVLLFEIGRRWKGPWVGGAAVAIFLCATRVAWMARVGRPDALLFLTSAASLWCFWWEIDGQRKRSPLFDLRAAAAMAAACLLVGPVALASSAASLLLWRWWMKSQKPKFGKLGSDRDRLREQPRWRITEWCVGLACYLLWAGLASWNGGEEFRQAFWQTRTDDVLKPEPQSLGWSLWFPAPRLFIDFFPWSLLLPPLVWDYWNRRRELFSGPDGRRRAFLVSWIAMQFAVLSVAGFKRLELLAPIFPPLALAVADWLDERRRYFERRRQTTVAHNYMRTSRRIAVTAVLLAAVVAPLLYWGERQFTRKGGLAKTILQMEPFKHRFSENDEFVLLRIEQVLREQWPLLGIVLAASVVGVGLIHVGWYGRRHSQLVAGFAAPWAVCFLLQVQVLSPRLDGLRNMERFGKTVRHFAEPGRTIHYFGPTVPDLVFHAGKPSRRLASWEEFEAVAASQTAAFVVLMPNEAMDLEKAGKLHGWKEIANNCSFGTHRDPRCLMTNRPEAAAGRRRTLPDSLRR